MSWWFTLNEMCEKQVIIFSFSSLQMFSVSFYVTSMLHTQSGLVTWMFWKFKCHLDLSLTPIDMLTPFLISVVHNQFGVVTLIFLEIQLRLW